MVMIQEYCGLEFQIWDSSPRSWRLTLGCLSINSPFTQNLIFWLVWRQISLLLFFFVGWCFSTYKLMMIENNYLSGFQWGFSINDLNLLHTLRLFFFLMFGFCLVGLLLIGLIDVCMYLFWVIKLMMIKTIILADFSEVFESMNWICYTHWSLFVLSMFFVLFCWITVMGLMMMMQWWDKSTKSVRRAVGLPWALL